MSAQSIESVLCAYISTDLLDGMDIAPADELLLTDLLDSLAVMRLVAFMEETWSISISPDDVVLETMQTVDAMTAFLMGTHKVGT